MKYTLSEKYNTPKLMAKIMGPNPVKLEEEMLQNSKIKSGAVVCDLGSGQGLTSVFLAKEYGYTVYAADLWSDPEENRKFFLEMGLDDNQIIPVKADAEALPFEKEFFDAVISTDSYNYFGRDENYLDEKLLPFVKSGGYIYIAIPGMKKDCHENLPSELLLSWTPEQLEYMHDTAYWADMVGRCKGAEVICVEEMESNDEVWADWLKQDNEYAVGDRKSMEAGGGKYLNFIKIVLKKRSAPNM
ncbi:MAG: class I SAM-dependent methyltransferase [Acutalibacteraceae bacterium]|nr:class I SAM-dependent methyltransferase [Acutalibacteraceae bacterium]